MSDRHTRILLNTYNYTTYNKYRTITGSRIDNDLVRVS